MKSKNGIVFACKGGEDRPGIQSCVEPSFSYFSLSVYIFLTWTEICLVVKDARKKYHHYMLKWRVYVLATSYLRKKTIIQPFLK